MVLVRRFKAVVSRRRLVRVSRHYSTAYAVTTGLVINDTIPLERSR